MFFNFFVNEEIPLQAKDLCKLFVPDFSVQGSNRRSRENSTICFWRDWLIDIEGILIILPVTILYVKTFYLFKINFSPIPSRCERHHLITVSHHFLVLQKENAVQSPLRGFWNFHLEPLKSLHWDFHTLLKSDSFMKRTESFLKQTHVLFYYTCRCTLLMNVLKNI